MSENEAQIPATRVLTAIAAFVIIVAGMRAATDIVVPFLLSLFIAIIAAPALHWLTGKRVPLGLAMTVVVALIVAIALIMAAVVGSSLEQLSEQLPFYKTRLREMTSAVLTWLEAHRIPVSRTEMLKYLDPASAINLAAGLLNGLGAVLANAFLIFLTSIFILLETTAIPEKLNAALRRPEEQLIRFRTLSGKIQRYMSIKTWLSLATGTLVSLWLWVLGVDFPVLWGLLAFLLNYVPNIGSIIAAVPAVMLALIQLGVPTAMWTAAGYVVINIVAGNIIEPRFMGRGLGLSTLVVFASLVFWGWVLGTVGMFLSVPLTMMMKIVVESGENTRWIGVLLSDHAPRAVPEPKTGDDADG